MEACASVSGGVMFVPDHIEGGSRPLSYKEFVKQEHPEKPLGIFGRKTSGQETVSKKVEKAA